MHPPDIELFSQNKRIIYGSDLSDIFERHELQKAVDEEESKQKFQEKEIMFKPKEKLVG